MSHRGPRQSGFLLSAVILSLTFLASVACAAAEPTPTTSPFRIAASGKIARRVQAIATPGKIARRAQAAEFTGTPSPVPTDTPTDFAPTATDVPVTPNGGLPKGAGQPPMRLIIPTMNLDVGIREATRTTFQQSGQLYADWVIPYDAAGHLLMTANAGESGNMVISGHHNLIGPNQFGKGLFGGLWDLQVGDAIYVFDEGGRAFAYSVTKSYNVKEAGEPLPVREEHAREIMADTGEPILTLTTCWNGAAAPYSGNTYRWIVAAHLVNPIQPAQVPVIVHNPTPM